MAVIPIDYEAKSAVSWSDMTARCMEQKYEGRGQKSLPISGARPNLLLKNHHFYEKTEITT